jgi:hypothetical protein
MKYLWGLLAIMTTPAVGQGLINVARQNVDSICRVKADMGGGHGAVGTGCLIGPTAVLTADHVTEGYPAKVQFRLEEIRVVDRISDKYADCVILKLERRPTTGRVLPIASQEAVGRVVCVGFDNGNPDKLRAFEGIAGPSHRWSEIKIAPLNARMAEHGNSGGPVLNQWGQVVSCLHSNSDTGHTYANSNTQLRQFLERIRQKTGESFLQWGTAPATGQPPQFTLNPPVTLTPPQQTIPVQPSQLLPPSTAPVVPFNIQGGPQPIFLGRLYLHMGQ